MKLGNFLVILSAICQVIAAFKWRSAIRLYYEAAGAYRGVSKKCEGGK